MTQPATAAPRPDAPPLGVTLAILGISSLTVMANATIAPALPGLRDHFGDTPGIETLAGLVVTLPSLFVVLTAGLFGILVDRFDNWLTAWLAEGFEPLRQPWLDRAWHLGEPIRVRLERETMEGRFAGLGRDGVLVLELSSGLKRYVAAGEVFPVGGPGEGDAAGGGRR